jgi:hypothetical protein
MVVAEQRIAVAQEGADLRRVRIARVERDQQRIVGVGDVGRGRDRGIGAVARLDLVRQFDLRGLLPHGLVQAAIHRDVRFHARDGDRAVGRMQWSSQPEEKQGRGRKRGW